MNQDISKSIERFQAVHLEFQRAENSLAGDVHQYMYTPRPNGQKPNVTQLRALADQLPMNSIARRNVYQRIYRLQEEQEKQIRIQTELRGS